MKLSTIFFVTCFYIRCVKCSNEFQAYLDDLESGLNLINRKDVFEERNISFSSSEKEIIKHLAHRIDFNPLKFSDKSLSAECRIDSQEFIDALSNFELWALNMFDASAKLPSGILRGNINQFGDFDQCLSVVSRKKTFTGQYCLASIMISFPKEFHYLNFLRKHFLSLEPYKSRFKDPSHLLPKSSEIHWALCVPSSCLFKEVEFIIGLELQNFINDSSVLVELEVKENMCQKTRTRRFSQLSVGTLLSIGLLIFIVLLSLISSFLAKIKVPTNKWLEAFSVVRNIESILSTRRSKGELSCLDGIRLLNAWLLVFAHKGMVLNLKPTVNGVKMNDAIKGLVSVPARSSLLNTDIFLMLSGLLMTYSFIGRLQRGQRINIFKEIAGRYIRFMPPLAALIIFAAFILPHLGSGPLWNMIITHQADLCKAYWWRSFLMIHNWFGFENMCIMNTHHVATDFELFAFSTILVVFLYKSPTYGVALISLLVALSSTANFLVTANFRINPYVLYGVDLIKFFEVCDFLYLIPPLRFTVYAIGIFLGFILRKFKDAKPSDFQITLGWCVAFTCLTLTFWGCVSSQKYTPITAACYSALAPITWCLFFSWVIFAAQTGNKNFLIVMAEWKYFKIGSNLSYGLYLVQFLVFYFNISVTRTSTHFHFYTSYLDLNELSFIVVAGVFLTLFIEYPFLKLKRLLLDEDRSKLRSKTNEVNDGKNIALE